MGNPVSDVPGLSLLERYDELLPQIYGYLLRRCGDRPTAEDLTAETFLAAVTEAQAGRLELSAGWLIGVARNKLVDHWRRCDREQRLLSAVGGVTAEAEDPWDAELDQLRAEQVLCRLGPHHQAVLALRYLDGLSVPATAAQLHRTVHATEALLVRARKAFRVEYLLTEPEGSADE